ncbi:MAG: peptide-methionine (S)-S-oxide reductase [Haliea sp.]|nr:MAG: peptide-methionine (S)-S-oxide reductase [Haliea sp.]
MNRILFSTGAIALAAWTFMGGGLGVSAAEEKAVQLPPPAIDMPLKPAAGAAAPLQTAVFAGGCFWGVQAVFQHTAGVVNAVSGYSGGDASTARYELIGSGRTGHAEAVRVTYDPATISYGKLLQIYFSVAHDPTTLNRQGPDTGTQYRSALFYQDAGQQKIAQSYIAQLDAARVYPGKIVTEVTPLKAFYPAEAYHQDYLALNPHQPYIVRFDMPKLANLKAVMPEVWREKPALVSQAGQ